MRGFRAYAVAVAIVLSVICCANLALASQTTPPVSNNTAVIGNAPVGNDLSLIDVGGFLRLLGGFLRIGVGASTATTSTACPQGTSYPDGCSGAPGGSPNAPGLFTDNQATGGTGGTYNFRPPWNVAGVDYRTGYDTTITLKSPDSGGFPSCANTSTYPHTITVTSAPCTISGYDLSLDGGWSVMTTSACSSGTVTIKNNNFVAGSNSTTYLVDALGDCNLDLEANTFDGNGCNYPNNLSALVSYSGTGTFTARYNQFLNSPEHDINFEQPSGSGYVASSSFNYFRGVGYSTGSHANPFIFNTSGSFSSFTSEFDTIIIPSTTGDYSTVGVCPANSAIAGAGSSGNIYLSPNATTLSGVVVSNDTLIASPVRGGAQGFDTFIVRADGSGNSVPSPQIINNYFDVSGILSAGVPFLETTMTSPTISGNILLTNGDSCNTNGSCN